MTYHFIFKELAEEFKGQFECLGENTEKCINFSVSIQKEIENDKKITYRIKFTDSFRFMLRSLSSLFLKVFITVNAMIASLVLNTYQSRIIN